MCHFIMSTLHYGHSRVFPNEQWPVRYNASKTTFYKARVDSLGVMGASFSQKLTDQVKFTMSAEMRSLADQANRVGAAFEFN